MRPITLTILLLLVGHAMAEDAPSGGRTLEHKHPSGVAKAVFSPDGKTIACSTKAGIHLWDVEKLERKLVLEGPAIYPITLVFSPDGQMLAGATTKRQVYLWKTNEVKPLHVITPEEEDEVVRAVGFINQGKELITTANHIRVWDTVTAKVNRTFARPNLWINNAVLSQDGRWLAIEDESAPGATQIWRVKTGKAVGSAKPTREMNVFMMGRGATMFTPDGTRLIWSDQIGAGFFFFEAPSGRYIGKLPFDAQIAYAAISDDGRTLVFTDHKPMGDSFVIAYDIQGKREITRMGPFPKANVLVSISPKGDWVAGIPSIQSKYKEPILWKINRQ